MSLTFNTPGVEVIDDTDPSIVYHGSWLLGGAPGEFNTSTHGALTAGSTTTLQFSGTSFAVYGTLGTEGEPVSTYNLDNFPPVTYSAPPVNSANYHTLFYQSPTLSSGTHHLVITFQNGSGTLWLDYFLFLPNPAIGSSLAPLPSSTIGSSLTPLPSNTISSSLAPSSTTAPVPGSAASTSAASTAGLTKNAEIGIAVGGAVGGLLLLILLAFLLHYWRLVQRYQAFGQHPRPLSNMDPFPAQQQRYLYDHPIPPVSKDTRTYVTASASNSSTTVYYPNDPATIARPFYTNMPGYAHPRIDDEQLSQDSPNDFRSQPGTAKLSSSGSGSVAPPPEPIDQQSLSSVPRKLQEEQQTIANNMTLQMNSDHQAYAGVQQGEAVLGPNIPSHARESRDIPPAYGRY